MIPDPCPACRGVGRVESARDGLDRPPRRGRYARPAHGARPRARGRAGAPRGDLELIVRVREHKVFERDGHNLICQYPISFARAALGGPIEITDADRSEGHGRSAAREPDAHDGASRRRSRDAEPRRPATQGRSAGASGRRDADDALSPEQEELFRKLAEIEGTTPPAARKGLFGKLKDLISGENPPTEERK